MAKFERCPNCGNKEHGDSIYKCNKCATIFCDVCKKEGDGFFSTSKCPTCESTSANKLTEIQAG